MYCPLSVAKTSSDYMYMLLQLTDREYIISTCTCISGFHFENSLRGAKCEFESL